MKSTRILFTGGGTGGHVYPLLAVAEEIEKIAIDQQLFLKLYYAGGRDQFSRIAAENGLRIVSIASSKIRRYGSLKNLIDIPKFFFSIIQALVKLYIIMPDVVFSKGGPGALPVVFAAWWYRIPVIIHESDSVPGISNLFSARFATRVALSFEQAASYFSPEKTLITGNPIRFRLLANIPTPDVARAVLHLDATTPTVLILGGSIGSVRINQFIIDNLPAILPHAQIIHQTGIANIDDCKNQSAQVLKTVPDVLQKEHPYVLVDYFRTEEELQNAYAAADVIVSRSGASSIFEIAAFGKPAILVPLFESANDHQRTNAYSFSEKTGAVVIEEENLLPGIFLKELTQLLADSARRKAISQASWKFFVPSASVTIAQELLRLAR